jgi:hypothetical protein
LAEHRAMNLIARRTLFFLSLASLVAAPLAADSPKVTTSLEARIRYEATTAPSPRADRDRSYDFSTARLRLGLDLAWEHVSLHGLAQGTAIEGLPRNGAFGIGPSYLGANRGDRSPEDFSVAELTARFHDSRSEVTVGRQRFADGVELLPGVAYLDEVQRAKLGERLLGNWDWVAAGRRWDGASAALRSGPTHLSGFYLRPLQGGTNVRRAFRAFDSLEVYGATLASPFGVWLPHSALRLQAIHYDDERPAARLAAGAAISIDTLAASALVGDEDDALLAWFAMQRGDWGRERQDAGAMILGAGHRFSAAPGQPSVYLGYERASGERPAGGHQGFFNLLPTNHKFYGSMDYSAFSNLRDVYIEVAGKPRPALRLQAGLHDFALLEEGDAWYAGSGAFDDQSLGFAARRPAGGRFGGRDLGRELDLDAVWTARPGLELRAGGGLFDAGAAGAQVLTAARRGHWLYHEMFWRH